MELLVSIGTRFTQFTVPVGEARLRADVRALRIALERRTTNAFLVPARRLHDLLVAPMQSLLTASHVNTLVFVPDGVLRTIPPAALHDGTKFLIERFAIAVVPGLRLVDPQPLSKVARKTLAAGLSVSRDGYAPLPNVAVELNALQDLRHGRTLLNGAFLRANLAHALEDDGTSVLHIASHGSFGADPSLSFVLAYDGEIRMDELEDII